jgi:soluble lytic murein transglycosylase-like protein
VVSAAVATDAAAQVDWRRAGGDLFVEPTRAESADARAQADTRLLAAPQPFEAAIDEAAARHRIDPKLLRAVVAVESGFRPTAVSPVGAAGLTQLMPQTARELGVADRLDPAASLSGGADYLARLLLRFRDLRLALAAYNAGPGRVAQLGRIPTFPETQAYVGAVVDCYLALAAGRGVRTRQDCRSQGR